ncbi:MAG: hypothetical protein AMXMBFR64_33530 [Myxococcales bacterium]
MRATDVVGGRYRLVERLGEGGFGEVWRAEQLVAGEAVADVAVKGLRAGADLREIRLLARLSHPHVLRFRDAFDDDGRLYLVTDLAEGGSAADLLRTYQGGVPGPEVARVVREAAEGLAYLHGQRVVHRDVKPANLLFVEGRVVVGDVGLAKATEHSLSRHSGQGSMAYAAPEMFDGQVGPPSDVYGLAVAAYELLTGRLPFEGTDKQIMMGHVAKPVVVPEGVSGSWQELLVGCLVAGQPQRRPRHPPLQARAVGARRTLGS